MKISYLILLGFFLILILFTVTTYINYRQAEEVNENSEFFARSTVIVRHTNRFQRNILNMVSGLRGYLFTGENHFIQAYDSAALENVAILNDVSALLPDTSTQRQALLEIEQLNNRWMNDFAAPLINAKKNAGLSDSSQLAFNRIYRQTLVDGSEKRLNQLLQDKFRDFSNYEFNMREVRKEVLTQSIQRTRKISFYLTTISIVLGLAIAIFLAYRISTRILRMANMADHIAAGNYNVQMADEGRDEISKLTRSLNHMARMLSENITLLKRKNDELGQFAHIVSHDLKAPLRGIDNVVTWIEEDHAHELSPKLREYVNLIKGRLTRAENLIQGILTYARIGRETPPSPEKVNVNQLVQEILESMPSKSSLQFEVKIATNEIITERVPLQQVLSNLIGNAIKYHDKHDGKVTITLQDKKSHYEFVIADNGPGIAQNYHEKIFMIFQTLQERDSFESTGVGLAIVKKILDDRKQTIKVKSAPGKGSSFIFTWPK
jgi:signal transduction histidine kinase